MLLGLLFLAFGPAPSKAVPPRPDPAPREWVRAAVDRMGGPALLQGLSTLRIETSGYRQLLEQSERPEGPWIPQLERTTELWDSRAGRFDSTAEIEVGGSHSTVRTVVAGGAAARRFGDRWQPSDRAQVAEAEEWMALSPHEALLAALAAPDLRREPGLTFQGIPHHVVSFAARPGRVRILLNSQTGFLTACETTRAYPEDRYWQVWGDVLTRVSFSFWDLRPGGLFYPLQWDIERGGRPWRTVTLTKLEGHPAFPDEAFVIPEDVRTAFAERARHSLDDPVLGNPARPAVELAPGIVLVPGSWAVTLVAQRDGVVVIEAPISAGYSARVVEEAGRRFPGLPVKAVVTTSDAWPHFGGIREYVARGIPVTLLDVNGPQIRRALESRHRSHPDALASRPRRATLHAVSGRTVLGDGPNRIELFPVRGETGERMMLAWFPETGLLYASDLFQGSRDGPPEYAWEVAQVVRRHDLRVRTLFAMHTDPIPWARVLEIIENAAKRPEH